MSPDFSKPPRIMPCLCCGVQYGYKQQWWGEYEVVPQCECGHLLSFCRTCYKCPAHCRCLAQRLLEAVDVMLQFQASMTELQTMAGHAQEEWGKVAQGILDMAGEDDGH